MKESNDILTLFESLNNHEVFTPPRLARDMLSTIPKKVWCNPNIRVLDPCVKSGVFLREAMYLLFEGLLGKGLHTDLNGVTYDLSNPKQLMRHILKNMLFGIATSELTGYLSRRTLYGVMEANTDKQTALIDAFEKSKNNRDWSEKEKVNFLIRNRFNDYYDHNMFNVPEHKGYEHEGNIFYPREEVQKKVVEDGNYEIEDTYYPFIEGDTQHAKIQSIKGDKMKFDVIIGNPPYQISDGGNGASAMPVYHRFIENAIELNPRFISMIVPSRWYVGGRGLKDFRDSMLADKKLSVLHDFPEASECFPGVMIKGGVNYFLWDSNHKGDCEIHSHRKGQLASVSKRSMLEPSLDTFIRDNEAISILRKVISMGEKSFAEIISANDPFGFDVRVKGSMKRIKPTFSNTRKIGMVPFYYNGWRKDGLGYIEPEKIRRNTELTHELKFFAPKAVGVGDRSKDLIKPFIPEPDACCTETYLAFGPFTSETEMVNAISYVNTKFFHFLVSLKKITQEARRGVYELVPMQDFSEPWNDRKLYEKYGLDESEVNFIENNVRDMES